MSPKKKKKSTKSHKFKPTQAMVSVLSAACANEAGWTITGWCKTARVDRSTWYKWIDVEGFLEWFHEHFDKWINSRDRTLDARALAGAINPNTPDSAAIQWWDRAKAITLKKKDQLGRVVAPSQDAVDEALVALKRMNDRQKHRKKKRSR